jgi:ABC-type phosphate transport system substrate-binding protein
MRPVMKSIRTSFAAKFLTSAILVLALARGTYAQSNSVAVVVSPKNSLSSLSLGELRKILSGEKRSWSNGTHIKIFSLASGTPERNAMLKLLGKSETDYKQYWSGMVYRGEAEAEPMVLPSIGMLKEALTAYPGAISLLSASDVKPGMKVLKVDGKMPDEESYPLHP